MQSSGIQCPGKGGSFLNDTVNRADNSLNGELTTNRKLQVMEYEEFGVVSLLGELAVQIVGDSLGELPPATGIDALKVSTRS